MQLIIRLLFTFLVFFLESNTLQAVKTDNPFYIIAHMANSKAAVNWAVTQGANAIECDIHFDNNGNPSVVEHGPGCACDCVPVSGHVCNALQYKCSGPEAREDPATYMQNLAHHGSISLYFLDSKVGSGMGAALVKAGRAIIPFMDKHLFGYGYRGKVIISSASFSTFAYVQEAAIAAKRSPNANRYFFTIDQEEQNYAGVMNKLYPFTTNRVYGTGGGSCGVPSDYYSAIQAAVAGKKKGENGMNYIYTVDKEDIMRKYIDVGVEGIMTNRPALARQVATSMGVRIANPDEPIPFSKKKEKRIDIVQTIEPESGPFGQFTTMVYCDADTWAIGFRQRVEQPCGNCDDTGLNALELICGRKNGNHVHSITAHNGYWGDWSNFVYCSGGNNFMNGASFKIEGSQGTDDDTTATDSQFSCSQSSDIRASNGVGWGDWKPMKRCPRSSAICGFSLKLEDVQDTADDTVANGAKFDCCAI